MTSSGFDPTPEQTRIIEHTGSAFIAACPGAGKTKVMVERARRSTSARRNAAGRGLAFLSFTKAAVSELESRLYREGVIGMPAFPHFVGTFDGFLWQFLIAPFGIQGVADAPKLIPDKGKLEISPTPKLRSLPLECFDRATGLAIQAKLDKHGFSQNPKAYETTARLRDRPPTLYSAGLANCMAHMLPTTRGFSLRERS